MTNTRWRRAAYVALGVAWFVGACVAGFFLAVLVVSVLQGTVAST